MGPVHDIPSETRLIPFLSLLTVLLSEHIVKRRMAFEDLRLALHLSPPPLIRSYAFSVIHIYSGLVMPMPQVVLHIKSSEEIHGYRDNRIKVFSLDNDSAIGVFSVVGHSDSTVSNMLCDLPISFNVSPENAVTMDDRIP